MYGTMNQIEDNDDGDHHIHYDSPALEDGGATDPDMSLQRCDDSSQLTLLFRGQVYVFNSVTPEKAQAVLLLLGGCELSSGSQCVKISPNNQRVVVGDAQRVSGSNSWATKDGRKAWQQKSHDNKNQNSPPPPPPSSSSLDSHVSNTDETQTTEKQQQEAPFDICPPKQGGGVVVLKALLLVKNRERRKEMTRGGGENKGVVLRPGMVLLKAHIPITDQVNIVKRCRELGMGHGGFYQPGRGDGTKLHLKMMCLGKNWDCQTKQYGSQRPSDGAHPPPIPPEFLHLIQKAIDDSHALIQQQHSIASDPRKILPSFSPDICTVNFYSQNGRLGLHQDKGESEESLCKGLPVVSFSIGDSAEFLYGDHRDVDKAQKVVLESGDVLIFGGKSRHVFHGVTTIHPMTAPNLFLEQTNLRPGRLNLTFRQY